MSQYFSNIIVNIWNRFVSWHDELCFTFHVIFAADLGFKGKISFSVKVRLVFHQLIHDTSVGHNPLRRGNRFPCWLYVQFQASQSGGGEEKVFFLRAFRFQVRGGCLWISWLVAHARVAPGRHYTGSLHLFFGTPWLGVKQQQQQRQNSFFLLYSGHVGGRAGAPWIYMVVSRNMSVGLASAKYKNNCLKSR